MSKETKSSFASRWAAELESWGFVQISSFFLINYHRLKPEPLNHNEAMFVIHLMQFKWDDSAPYPSYSTIAKRMGLTTKSVQRYARGLQNKGYLKRLTRSGRSNKYYLDGLMEALIKLEHELDPLG